MAAFIVSFFFDTTTGVGAHDRPYVTVRPQTTFSEVSNASQNDFQMELSGFEPLTPSMPLRCSTN
jgi:hypothetical protein